MKLTIVTLVAAAAAYLVTRACVDELARRAAVRARNHRGLEVAATGGIALVLGWLAAGVVAALAIRAWSDGGAPLLDVIRDIIAVNTLIVVATVAGIFALLGLYDDVAGDGSERGWREHVTAIRMRRATPGALKLVGGAAAAIVASDAATVPQVIVAAAIVALSANLINAFDLRPLRAFKASILWVGVLLVGTLLAAEVTVVPGLVVVSASILALWKPEASERIMLGDSGANALGATLGVLSLTATTSETARFVTLAILAALTVVSAKPGFSVIIRRIGVLGRLDALGRQADPIPSEPVPDEPL